jgi:hypothetical protein
MRQNYEAMTRNSQMPKSIKGPRATPETSFDPCNTQWIYQYGKMYGCGNVLRHIDALIKPYEFVQ